VPPQRTRRSRSPRRRLSSKADAWVIKELAAATTVPVLVQMPSQADLSQAAAITDKTARGRYVYETLSKHAEATQGDLRSWLASRGVQHQPFWVANMILVHADAATAEALANRPDVKRLSACQPKRAPGTAHCASARLRNTNRPCRSPLPLRPG
jgi:hypothetical protein